MQIADMKNLKTGNRWYLCQIFILVIFFASCAKDEYYNDGGLANAKYNGSVLQYLESKPIEFDSLVQVIKIAGLEEMLSKQEITLFTPTDRDIKELIGTKDRGNLNGILYELGQDTIKTLDEIDPIIWRKYLERHIFKGKNKLTDYPQVDFGQITIYPGQNYYSINNSVSHIGVVFNDVNGVRYLGYRQLHISYIPDVSRPDQTTGRVRITTSDIQPDNGVVHILHPEVQFGFNLVEMINEIIASRR